jgi:tetratricopeptide (TPR) repeat protein
MIYSVSLLAQNIREDRGRFVLPKSPEMAKRSVGLHQLWEETEHAKILGKAKLAMINGDLFKAKTLMLNLVYVSDYTKAIMSRYWAIIHFIEGDYTKAMQFMNEPDLQITSNFKHICNLKTLTYLILEKENQAFQTWSECYAVVVSDIVNPLWNDVLVTIKQNPSSTTKSLKGLTLARKNKDQLELILKLALYLNESHLLVKEISAIDVEMLKHERIRELIGLVYYRQGRIKLAYKFLEDLNTPNAEVIKGNIYLAQDKVELALAQYRLAIKAKSNSINAIERLLPIAWRLEQWDTGLIALNQLKAVKDIDYTSMIVEAAFETMKQNYDKALKITDYLDEKTGQSRWDPLAYVKSYLLIQKKELRRASYYSFLSCLDGNPVMCWTYQQMLENPDVIEMNEVYTTPLHDARFNIAQYTAPPNPIDERVFISQKEIEELDDALINLE